MMIYFTIGLIVIGVILLKLITIVPMREAVVVERFGKFKNVCKPGLHFLIPFVDNAA